MPISAPDPDSSPYESSSSELDSIVPNKKIRFFERIYIKRDNINNVGNLICFPLRSDGTTCETETQILIVGGLNIGLLSGKCHVYDEERRKVNCRAEYEIPIPDVSRFYYRYRDDNYYVVGQYRIHEFNMKTKKWRSISLGIRWLA